MNRKQLRRSVRRTVGTVPGALEATRAAKAAARTERDVRFVVASGVFDREWYEAQLGRAFDSDAQAVRHYLRTGRTTGYSPHPLFEPSSATRAWRKSVADPFLDALRRSGRKRGRPHPAVTFGTPFATTDFLTWASKAKADTPVPVTGGDPVKWGRYRTSALRIAREQGRLSRLAVDADPVDDEPAFDPALSAASAPSGPDAPLVSIVMATWNRAHVLKRAVASVRAQQWRNWELIIVDDGSDDDTALVLQGMCARDERIRAVEANHGGVCRARNLGLAAARGRYVAFLDSDNSWTPQFLAAAVGFAEEEKAEWVHAGIEMRRNGKVRWRAYEGDREHLLAGNYIDLNVVVARRTAMEAVGGFDETLRRAVDYDLVLRLSELAGPRLVPVLGAVYVQDDEDANRISVAEPFSWNYLVKQRHLARELRLVPPLAVPGRTTVVVPVRSHPGGAVDLINELAATPGDVELVVVLCGADPWAARIVSAAAINRPNVRVVSSPGEFNFAAAVDLGAGEATGDVLVAWRSNCRAPRGWLPPLREALRDPGVGIVQPVNLSVQGLVASAGAVFVPPDLLPSPWLGGMPVEDLGAQPTDSAQTTGSAETAAPVVELPAVLSDVVALRTADYRAAGGMDALVGDSFAEVDLALRLRETAGLSSALARTCSVIQTESARRSFPPDPASAVRILRTRHDTPPGSTQLWQSTGFEVLGRRLETVPAGPRSADDEGAVPVVRPRVHENPAVLRWAIDIAAPAGPSGDQWGDWHFARSLARSLEKLGQRVHVDRREARTEAHRAYDDVTLVLRGLDDVRPRPGGRSIMWIISHPDLVTEAEAARHDVVFAASEFWAEATSKRWGTPVTPLMQCTDADLFTFGAAPADSGPEFVFVGNSRGVRRASVFGALEAGLPLSVWGRGWQGLVPDEAFAGDYIANTDLPALYASAGVVLNDHWDDMRHEGFVSNRIFDVLAAGGRIVSDDIPGLEHVVGTTVPVFHSHHDLARLFAGDWRTRFPDLDARRATSDLVRREHSFDARARQLLDTALRLHAVDDADR